MSRKRSTRHSWARGLRKSMIFSVLFFSACLSHAATRFEEAETLWIQGRYADASTTYVAALGQLARADWSDTSRSSAEVELALRRLLALGQQDADASKYREVFDTWAAEKRLAPSVRALARYYGGVARFQSTGDIDAAREHWRPLGFLDSWRVVGSFDNERGGGFDVAYPPEESIDYSAKYDGKKYSIAWRELPARPFAGRVDFDALFSPNDECLAYALTFVKSDSARDAALRFGSDEGYKVWVNGALVDSNDVHRTRSFDQTSLGIRLESGWNSILFKVAEGKGRWELQARLTATNGEPLANWEEGHPEESEPVTTLKKSTTEAVKLPQSLTEKLASGTHDDARSAYLLGTLLLSHRAHDVLEHPDREALRRAVDLAPDEAIYHLLLAESFSVQTAIAAERDDNEWRNALEKAATRGALTASLELGRYYLRTFDNYTLARRHTKRALAGNPDWAEAQLFLGQIDGGQRFPKARSRALRAALATGSRSPQVVFSQARQLNSQGRQGARLELLEKFVRSHETSRTGRALLIEALIDHGKLEDVQKEIEIGQSFEPFSTSQLERYATIALGRDDVATALSYLNRALAIVPENHALHNAIGEAHWHAGQRDETFVAWERSLELQPNQPELRKRLEFVRSTGPSFDEEFRRETAELIAKAIENPAKNDEAAQLLLDFVAVEVNKDGTAREFSQQVVQVLNDRGLRMFDSYGDYYAANDQVFEFKKARVTHTDGTTADARLSRFGGGGGGSGDYRQARVNLPTMSAGDVFEVQSIKEDIAQSFFGDYFGRREIFQSNLTTARKVFVLRVPADRKFYFHNRHLDIEPTKTVDADGETITYTWTLDNIAKVDAEPAMPSGKEVFPLLEISTFKSWAEFSSWYHNLIKKQFESSPEIAAKVRELTSGKTSEIDKIRALYNFVVTDIRYNAWEFGVHGFKPYNASTVFARRFGDCKDKATLLTVLLDEVGIQSEPVLIFAEGRRGNEDLSLPMINHFNHCITHVPAKGDRPELYLDGTASFHSLEELPSMDRGARVLVVEPTDATIHQIPWNELDGLSLEEEWDVQVDADGNAKATIRLRGSGDFAVSIRRLFEVAGQRKTNLDRMFGRRFAGAEVTSNTFSDLGDLNAPVTASFDVTLPNFVTDSPEGPSIVMPEDIFSTGASLGQLGGLEERQYDILLGNPRRSSLKAVIRLPKGMTTKSVPEARDRKGSFGLFRLTFDTSANQLTLDRKIAVTATRIEAKQYAAFREFTADLDRMRDEKIILKTGNEK